MRPFAPAVLAAFLLLGCSSSGGGGIAGSGGTGGSTGGSGGASGSGGSGGVASPCDAATGSLGCSFMAVDLDESDDNDALPWVLVIGNPDPASVARVTIAGPGVTAAGAFEVPAHGQLAIDTLPAGSDVDATGVHDAAYFSVTSDSPVTVLQANAASGMSGSYDDASLLLPAARLGKRYVVVSAPVATEDPTFAAYVDVVATTATSLTVKSGSAVPGLIEAGQTLSFTLAAGELLHLSSCTATSCAGAGTDLSGMEIAAAAPVAVFVGSRCSQVPVGVSFCDHLEEQLPPADSWGMDYDAIHSWPRGTEADVWRIVGSEDSTNLIATPQVAGVPLTINRGQVVDVTATSSFHLSASAPVGLAQLVEGSQAAGVTSTCDTATSAADPAMALLVPVEGYARRHIVVTPPGYHDYHLTVAAPAGHVPLLDGVALDHGTAVALGTDEGYQLTIAAGQHELTGDAPFGVTVFGYGCDFAFAAPSASIP